jgi:nitrite reductase (NADH) large subunit
MEIIIVGNSAAGTAAIEAIRKYDNRSAIIQISDEIHPLYSRCLVSYYIAGKIDRDKLLYRTSDFQKKMNVELHSGMVAEDVDVKRQQVRCSSGKQFEYDKLLIATGSSAKIPSNIPPDLDGVFRLRTLDDAIAIKNKIPQTKHAVVLGGGLIGMRAADALSACGVHVTVIVQSKHILSQMIDSQAAQIVQKRIFEKKIDILTETDIAEVISKKNDLAAVKTNTGKLLECEILIVAKGVRPNMQLIENSGIEKRCGIITNQYMQTNIATVFAAGDVAETCDITSDEYTTNALWTCAIQQGSIAGQNIADQQKIYHGSMGQNALNFFDISLISMGITAPKEESEYIILTDSRPSRNMYKKLVIKNHCLKGIILLGRIDTAGILLDLIQRKTDISGFEEELLDDNFNFGKIIKYLGKEALERYSMQRQ